MEKQTTKMEIGATYEKNGNRATITGEGLTSGGYPCWNVKVEKQFDRTEHNCTFGYITEEQLAGDEPVVIVENETLIIKGRTWDNIFNW